MYEQLDTAYYEVSKKTPVNEVVSLSVTVTRLFFWDTLYIIITGFLSTVDEIVSSSCKKS